MRGLSVAVVGLVALGAAGPAHATLLVRSDGAGFQLEDKNNLRDLVDITSATRNGNPAYRVRNDNNGDIFKFDRQAGCHSTSDGEVVECDRPRSNMIIRLLEGNDHLNMFDAPTGSSVVIAGPGDDFVGGQKGPDRVEAGTGADTVLGSDGNDLIFGQEHRDEIRGGNGNDELRGEGDRDFINAGAGTDVVRGGSGNDFIGTREETTAAFADTVDCGTGIDEARADLRDTLQSDCENVELSPVGETPNVHLPSRSLRVSRSGRVRARLRCPRGVRSLGCKGTLQLKLAKGGASASRSRKVRYSIKAGRRRTVTLQLTSRDVRTVRRRGRRARGVLTSIEKGRKGRKTTIRNLRLRLR